MLGKDDSLFSPDYLSNKSQDEIKSRSSFGFFLAGLTGSAAILLSVIALPFVSPALRKICLPYVPATDVQVLNVLSALKGRSGKLIDLGSGDGRIVIAAANEKFQAAGVELNPWLVLYSRCQAWNKGLSRNTSFIKRDLWKVNLTPYENIVIFGVDEMMEKLQAKLTLELNENSCVVVCRFPLPSWIPIATFGEGIHTVWLYYKPKTLI